MKKGGTSQRRGFTLVELLVVIAIIMILIAILLSVVIRVRQQAIQLQCASNLHQLGVAMMAYTHDNGVFPLQTFDTFGWQGGWGEAWPAHLRKFLGGNQKVFYCPAQDSRCEWKPDAPGPVVYADRFHTQFGYRIGERLLLNGSYGFEPKTRGMFFSYGCNYDGFSGRAMGRFVWNPEGWSKDARCKKITSVKRPEEFIIMADTAVDAVFDFGIMPWVDTQTTKWGEITIPGKVHRGEANVLFCDGHVRWYLQSDLVCKQPVVPQEAGKQRMWNADNQPAVNWP